MKFVRTTLNFMLMATYWLATEARQGRREEVHSNHVKVASDCKRNQYWSIIEQDCANCYMSFSSNLRSDVLFLSFYQSKTNLSISTQDQIIGTPDRLSCTCSADSRGYQHQPFTCVKCPDSTIATSDGFSCARCAGLTKNASLAANLSEQQATLNFAKSVDTHTTADLCPCPDDSVLRERYITPFNTTENQMQISMEWYCDPCPPRTKPKDAYTCQPCHRSYKADCTCPPPIYTEINGICVPNKKMFQTDLTDAQMLPLPDVPSELTLQPIRLYHGLIGDVKITYVMCRDQLNTTACNHLLNLCVLSHQSRSDPTLSVPTKIVCDFYDEVESYIVSSIASPTHWAQGSAAKVLTKFNETAKARPGDRFELQAMLTDFSGRFLGHKSIRLQHLGGACASDALDPRSLFQVERMFRYSVDIHDECHISLDQLFASELDQETLFFELSLVDQFYSSKDAEHRALPVVVLNRQELNRDRSVSVDDSKYSFSSLGYNLDYASYFADRLASFSLVRRFFVLDTFSGQDLGSVMQNNESQSHSTKTVLPLFVRYVKEAHLYIRIAQSELFSADIQLNAPLLVLEYETITRDSYLKDRRGMARSRLSVHFYADNRFLFWLLQLLLAVLCPLGVFHTLFRAWVWAKRANRNSLNGWILLRLFLLSARHVSHVFLLLVFGFTLHQTIFFKFSQSSHTPALPDFVFESHLYMYFVIGVGLHTVWLIGSLVERLRAQLFFVDWEPPKGHHSHQTRQRNQSETLKAPSNENPPTESNDDLLPTAQSPSDRALSAPSIHLAPESNLAINGQPSFDTIIRHNATVDNGVPVTASNGNDIGHRQPNQTGDTIDPLSSAFVDLPDVSVWRTYFVANEWLELISYRRITLFVHLIFFLFIFQTLELKNACFTNPSASLDNNRTQTPFSFTCRLAIGVCVHLILLVVQMIGNRFVYEQLFRDKIREFVDLCSVANVSVFALWHSRFGFYIHGKNATGLADVNMAAMQQSLLAEQEDQLGTGRGLLPNSDGQCFTMLVNDVLVQQLNRLRSHLLHPLSQRTLERRRSMNHAPGLPHHTSRISARMTQSWQAYFALNQLLTGVLNHLYSQYEYVVRQRSAFELMLDAEFPPADLEEQKTIFYADKCYSFRKLTLSGIEFDLLLLELGVFTMVDVVTFDPILASLIAFLLSNTIKRVFCKFAKQNLVEKSLVDERFLL